MLGQYRRRIYHGIWGSALFQSVYQPAAGTLETLVLMPEWYLVIMVFAVLSLLGVFWTPLLIALPLLILAVGTLLIQAGLSAARASFTSVPQSRVAQLKLRCLTAFLFLLHSLTRLVGLLGSRLARCRPRRASASSRRSPRLT